MSGFFVLKRRKQLEGRRPNRHNAQLSLSNTVQPSLSSCRRAATRTAAAEAGKAQGT
jgi:hypothetical protein